ncbi:hypothetical protein M885DRAFT_552381 [Pelagophyceae sp. CCMP2097]|nr:hypothetical protein M885DRAFT_552381 [Pelagophyceae sp. CCMP2097]
MQSTRPRGSSPWCRGPAAPRGRFGRRGARPSRRAFGALGSRQRSMAPCPSGPSVPMALPGGLIDCLRLVDAHRSPVRRCRRGPSTGLNRVCKPRRAALKKVRSTLRPPDTCGPFATASPPTAASDAQRDGGWRRRRFRFPPARCARPRRRPR